MLTKESFTRDEWNHLFRLFNMMSFSMFSCSHFSNFLCDPIGKQSAMSKRGQKATSSKGCETKTNGSSEGETRQLGYAARGGRGKILHRIWDIRSIRRMSMKDKVVIQEDLYGPPKTQKSNVLKWGDRKMLKIQIPGNKATRRTLRTQLVQGDLYGQRLQRKKRVEKINSNFNSTRKPVQGATQSFKTWNTGTINTWRRSSISDKRSWELQ